MSSGFSSDIPHFRHFKMLLLWFWFCCALNISRHDWCNFISCMHDYIFVPFIKRDNISRSSALANSLRCRMPWKIVSSLPSPWNTDTAWQHILKDETLNKRKYYAVYAILNTKYTPNETTHFSQKVFSQLTLTLLLQFIFELCCIHNISLTILKSFKDILSSARVSADSSLFMVLL